MDARLHGLMWATALLMLTGCNQPAAIAPVGGKVSFRDATLRNGIVVFTPDPGRNSTGKTAIGQIQNDGSYVLATGEANGVIAGYYRITVASFQGIVSPQGSYPPPPLAVPEKYLDPEASKLACQVLAGRSNNIDIVLEE